MIVKNSKSILLKLKSIMIEKEISQKDLAEKLCIQEGTLSSRFTQKNISINMLLEMCDALDLDMNIEFTNKGDTN